VKTNTSGKLLRLNKLASSKTNARGKIVYMGHRPGANQTLDWLALLACVKPDLIVYVGHRPEANSQGHPYPCHYGPIFHP
jgi:hypothetical protein